MNLKKLKAEQLIGKEFMTNVCGKCVVIDYKDCYNVIVRFENPHYITRCNATSLRNGQVNNPLFPSFLGVGYIGVGKYSTKDKFTYTAWRSMLYRAYGNKQSIFNRTYKGVEVCEEWKCFQNFADWCYSQPSFNNKDKNGRGFDLDKDLLVKGNKVYSPETCCLAPKEINLLLSSNLIRRGKYPIGVTCSKYNRFHASIVKNWNAEFLGSFDTSEEAFDAYKEAKESYVKEVAERWRGKIDNRLYQALINYEVDIND